MAAVYCALLHHPIRHRDGEIGTSAVTTLDVHDIARSACTFGLSGYFIVTPVLAQQQLVARILNHWDVGAGRRRMPERSEALRLCTVVGSVEEAARQIADKEGAAPRWIATAARSAQRQVHGFAEIRQQLQQREHPPQLLIFGTGHGLSDGVLDRADVLLEPIRGPGPYNHLSVRSAAAIIFDRLLAAARPTHIDGVEPP